MTEVASKLTETTQRRNFDWRSVIALVYLIGVVAGMMFIQVCTTNRPENGPLTTSCRPPAWNDPPVAFLALIAVLLLGLQLRSLTVGSTKLDFTPRTPQLLGRVERGTLGQRDSLRIERVRHQSGSAWCCSRAFGTRLIPLHLLPDTRWSRCPILVRRLASHLPARKGTRRNRRVTNDDGTSAIVFEPSCFFTYLDYALPRR